ncbi:MAG TPA: hypothetical protein VGM94_00695 [Galbitalea sp.]|jgi:hypothetical protein
MLTVILVIALLAIVSAVVAAWGRAPLWVAVVLLCVIELLRALPLGK